MLENLAWIEPMKGAEDLGLTGGTVDCDELECCRTECTERKPGQHFSATLKPCMDCSGSHDTMESVCLERSGH